MISRRDDFNDRFERQRRSIERSGRIIGGIIVLGFAVTILAAVAGVWLNYQCWASQDPNGFACWFVSDRVEVGVRQR